MEPNNGVPKSFGFFARKNFNKLKLPGRSRSKSFSSSSLNSTSTPRSSSTPRRCSSSSASLREDEIFMEVFRRFDTDNDGKISAIELRSYFGSMGEYMSHEDAVAVISELDSDGDSLIDLQDFLKLMKKEGGGGGGDGHDHNNHQEDYDDDLKAAFEMFEYEKGCGRITPKSLQRLFNRLGDTKSYDECVAMIQAYDMDGNGELDYHEFQQMMMA